MKRPFYGLDRFYINLLLKSCQLQRVAQNAKSCSKVAEHNLFMPSTTSDSLLDISVAIPKFPSLASPQSTTSVVTVSKETKSQVKLFMDLKLESQM